MSGKRSSRRCSQQPEATCREIFLCDAKLPQNMSSALNSALTEVPIPQSSRPFGRDLTKKGEGRGVGAEPNLKDCSAPLR